MKLFMSEIRKMILLEKLASIFLFIFIVVSCATFNDNTLNIAPNLVLPLPDPAMMAITININSSDQRKDTTLVTVNRRGKLVSLTASRDLSFLLQEVLTKQMSVRGYIVGGNSLIDLQIIVNQLNADVQQGDLFHKVIAKADISIVAQSKNGQQLVKNYLATYNIKGSFNATNEKISYAINSVLNNVIANMAHDMTITNFIKQNMH